MAQSAEDKAKAEAIVAGWTWQPAEGHNYRFRFSVRTLTRFYEAASMQPDELRLVVEYLKEQDVGDGKLSLLNKEVDFGSGWKAKDAWYQTSVGDKWANTESTRVRVYQVLYQAPSESAKGDGPYSIEKGCQYKVSHTFYWDVESIPAVPDASSGVEYRLLGVQRDKETGLFSCVLERRERVQQDVAEYVTGETAFQTTKEEQHIGVVQGQVGTTGKKASVSSGTIVRRKITKNPDCTSNVENETSVEKPVQGAVVEYKKTLRGTLERKIDRSQPNKLNASGMTVGETRRSEQTEGKLWNNEIVRTTNEPVGEIADSCSKSQLTHTDVKTENVVKKPTVERPEPAVNEELRVEARRTEENTWDVSTTRIVYTPKDTGEIVSGGAVSETRTRVGVNQVSVPTGGRGGVNVVRRASASPNDHGSFSTSEETTTFTPVKMTASAGSVSALETIEGGVHQTDAPSGTPGVNRSVGVSISINDHGSMTTSMRTIVYVPQTQRCSGGTTSQTETVEVGIHQVAVPSATPAANRREDVSVSINDHGSMSTQKRTIVYVPESRTVNGGTKLQTEKTEIGINQTTVPTASPAANKREDVSVSINDHGSMSTQKRTTTFLPRSAEISWQSNGGTYFHKSFSHQTSIPPVRTPTNGTASASVHQNTEGTYDGTITTFAPGNGGGGVTSGVIYRETGKDVVKRIVMLPGGKMRLAKWNVGWERGRCAYSSALQNIKGGISFEGYRSYCSGNSREAEWMKVTSVSFQGYEDVQGA